VKSEEVWGSIGQGWERMTRRVANITKSAKVGKNAMRCDAMRVGPASTHGRLEEMHRDIDILYIKSYTYNPSVLLCPGRLIEPRFVRGIL
jgi:hypothetical protein